MSNLIDTFRKIGNLSPIHEEELLNVIEQKSFPAKTLLQDSNKISDKIFFVEKGVARTFYYKDGKDITYWIAAENDFVGSMSSFFMRRPSIKMVETIEDCFLWEFEFNKLEAFFAKDKALEKLGRMFAYYGISLMESRFDNLHFNTAKERYEIIQKWQPNILQRVPLGIIASYLGITQETLSRIRS